MVNVLVCCSSCCIAVLGILILKTLPAFVLACGGGVHGLDAKIPVLVKFSRQCGIYLHHRCVQYSLRVSSTVLALRMNFFNYPCFYYVVFA